MTYFVSVPRYVRTQFASETSVKVEWEPPEKTSIHLQGYKIFWKEKGPNTSEHFKEVPKDDSSAIVDGLMEMTNYWVRVSAVFNEEEERLHHSQQIIFKTQKGGKAEFMVYHKIFNINNKRTIKVMCSTYLYHATNSLNN